MPIGPISSTSCKHDQKDLSRMAFLRPSVGRLLHTCLVTNGESDPSLLKKPLEIPCDTVSK